MLSESVQFEQIKTTMVSLIDQCDVYLENFGKETIFRTRARRVKNKLTNARRLVLMLLENLKKESQ